MPYPGALDKGMEVRSTVTEAGGGETGLCIVMLEGYTCNGSVKGFVMLVGYGTCRGQCRPCMTQDPGHDCHDELAWGARRREHHGRCTLI